MPQMEFLDVDPRVLRLPGSRLGGADPYKLRRRIASMAPAGSAYRRPWSIEARTAHRVQRQRHRKTQIAKLTTGETIRVEIIRTVKVHLGHFPAIGDMLP